MRPRRVPGRPGQTPEAYVAQKLDEYYAKGVRHLFPVHVFDNAFGGVSIYNPLFNYGNRLVNGNYFGVKDCGAFYGYKPQPDPALNAFVSVLGLGTPPANAFVSECNNRGLTPLGDTLVTGMMDRGMMIDLDHMSKDTFDAVLAKAEQRAYSGVVAGHTTLLKVLGGQMRIEGALPDANVTRIGALGGLVSPILQHGPRATAAQPTGVVQLPNAPIANDCGNSSKTFAQGYLAAIRFLGGRSVAAVGLGSDFNGLAGEPGPRFGTEGCPRDAGHAAQTGMVSYPFAIVPPPGVTDAGTLGRATAGARTFDFNFDGLAHVGLLPDLIADLGSAGAFPQDLAPLFRSAEQYLLAWQLAEANGKPLPTVTLACRRPRRQSGWFTTSPTVSATGAISAGAPALSGIVMSSTGAQLLDETLTAGNPVTLQVVADGVTEVSARARDAVGRLSDLATLAVKLDRVAPTVSCEPADGLWHSSAATVPCTAGDGTSGLADPADELFSLTADVAPGVESATVDTDTHAVTRRRRLVDDGRPRARQQDRPQGAGDHDRAARLGRADRIGRPGRLHVSRWGLRRQHLRRHDARRRSPAHVDGWREVAGGRRERQRRQHRHRQRLLHRRVQPLPPVRSDEGEEGWQHGARQAANLRRGGPEPLVAGDRVDRHLDTPSLDIHGWPPGGFGAGEP